MQIAKWILAGIVGATIGSVVWVAVEYFGGHDLNWLSIVIGVLSGICVRSVGAPKQALYLPGAIAAVVTVVGVLASVSILSSLIISKGPEPVPTLTAIEVAPNSIRAESDDAVEVESEIELDELDEGPSRRYSDVDPSSFSATTMIFYGIAALLAYVLGNAPRKQAVEDTSSRSSLADSNSAEEDEGESEKVE